jgi:hypothetical protein
MVNMANDLFESNVLELIKTIDYCFKDNVNLTGLILFYSVIDIMSWLSRDQHDSDATRNDFIRWVSEFMLPGSGLACTAEELYSARCNIVHSYAPEWGTGVNRRERETKKILYVWGKRCVEVPVSPVSIPIEKEKIVLVYTDELTNSLKMAIERFNSSLSFNRALSELVYERSEKYFNFIT